MRRGDFTDSRDSLNRRRGLVLILVLIVVAALSLAAYAFASLMVVQSESAHLTGRRIQARMLASSGVESLRVFLLQDPAMQSASGGLYDNPAMFQGVTVMGEADPDELGKFTVLVPAMDQAGGLAGIRYGLEDESARLNLNALLLIDQQARELQEATGELAELVAEDAEDLLADSPARSLLMALPGMTVEIADAILDWLDDDDSPREFGAEAEYYSSLAPPYGPKNGPLETVEELLLVRGVTPQLLFGSDVNRNGMIDPDEMALAAQLGDFPPRGWSAYLTLYSKEQNVNGFGQPRIDLNMDDLQQLYEELSLIFPEEWVKFIVAYRQSGPYQGEDEGDDDYSGDLDLSQRGSNTFTQVLDLIGARVEVTFQGAEEPVVLRSPFLDDLVSMNLYLSELVDNVTVVPDTVIPGRISLSQAPPEILLGIPGMTEEMVEQILSQRTPDPGLDDPGQRHETWLLTSGIVTLDEMRALMPFVCGGGDVYRTQVIGYFEDGRASARVEVVLDATQLPPRVLLWRDISHLGRGYPLEMLGVSLMDEN
ncbi:MAG: general secretion pathway protein GspK [Planctomycetaceae bacterium]|nr:MAG: general secretion pathway protein GspK [Planctomycetaceae bacterium]